MDFFGLYVIGTIVCFGILIYSAGHSVGMEDAARNKRIADYVKSLNEQREWLLKAIDDAKQLLEGIRDLKSQTAAVARDLIPEPDGDDLADVDVCLRVGMVVTCLLSETTHTHGRLVGFGIGPDGDMLAIVDVGAPHPMPISVDRVEPREAKEPGYRDNADPNKQWN